MTTKLTTKDKKYLKGMHTAAGKIRTPDEKEKLALGLNKILGNGNRGGNNHGRSIQGKKKLNIS